MNRKDLLELLEIVNRHAVTSPRNGGPQNDAEFASAARISRRLAVQLEKLGVEIRSRSFTLPEGRITLWDAASGSSLDLEV